jgi:hypothetical protein
MTLRHDTGSPGREQAHVSAEQPTSREDPRLPAAHAHPGGPGDYLRAACQRPREPLRLSSLPCCPPETGCGGAGSSRPRSAGADESGAPCSSLISMSPTTSPHPNRAWGSWWGVPSDQRSSATVSNAGSGTCFATVWIGCRPALCSSCGRCPARLALPHRRWQPISTARWSACCRRARASGNRPRRECREVPAHGTDPGLSVDDQPAARSRVPVLSILLALRVRSDLSARRGLRHLPHGA